MTTTNTSLTPSSNRAVDARRPPSETRIDRNKLVEVAEKSGLTAQDVSRFRLPLTFEVALTTAVKKAVTAFLMRPDLLVKNGGKMPTLSMLLNATHELTIAVRRRDRKTTKFVTQAVMAHQEIAWRQSDLYKEIMIKTGGGDALYKVLLPLLNASSNPARQALEQAVINCHKAVQGGKKLNVAIEWVGIDDEVVEVEPEKVPLTDELTEPEMAPQAGKVSQS